MTWNISNVLNLLLRKFHVIRLRLTFRALKADLYTQWYRIKYRGDLGRCTSEEVGKLMDGIDTEYLEMGIWFVNSTSALATFLGVERSSLRLIQLYGVLIRQEIGDTVELGMLEYCFAARSRENMGKRIIEASITLGDVTQRNIEWLRTQPGKSEQYDAILGKVSSQ